MPYELTTIEKELIKELVNKELENSQLPYKLRAEYCKILVKLSKRIQGET